MSFDELLPIILGLIWIVFIPLMRKRAKLSRAAQAKSPGNSNLAASPSKGLQSLFEQMFEEKAPTPEMYEAAEVAIDKPVEKKSYQDIFSQKKSYQGSFEHQESYSESFEHFDYSTEFEDDLMNESLTSPATFSEWNETNSKDISGRFKENIRQAVIFSEILRRPYAD